MRMTFVLCGAVVMAGPAAEARSPASRAPFRVTVAGTGTLCSMYVDGRAVSYSELAAVARRVASTGVAASVATVASTPPYRCVGGVIYTLQAAGFKKVGFVTSLSRPAR